MKTIKIAPDRNDCKIDGTKIIGTMDDRTFVYEFPKRHKMPTDAKTQELMINDFRAVIAMGSKTWWVESVLNNHWKAKTGKFYMVEA